MSETANIYGWDMVRICIPVVITMKITETDMFGPQITTMAQSMGGHCVMETAGGISAEI